MSRSSDILADVILGAVKAAAEVGLFVDGEEVEGGSYARRVVTWSAADDRTIKNEMAIEFPVATARWGRISEVRLFLPDGSEALSGDLTRPVEILERDQFVIPAEALRLVVL